jgi:hypothetical protein
LRVLRRRCAVLFTNPLHSAFFLHGGFSSPHPPLATPQFAHTQVTTGPYCARNARSLLRLYQRYPSRARDAVTDVLLLRALMALPEPDFVQALSLLPDAAATPAAPALSELEQLLQRAQFGEFWERAQGPSVAPLLVGQAGFVDAARGFIAGALRSAFRRVEPAVLSRALGLGTVEAVTWAEAHGWVVGEGGAVELPSTADNTPRPAKKMGEDGLGLGGARFADVSLVLRG